MIPLNVRNDGNIPELAPEDVIEVPCVVGAHGLRPRHAGPLPPQVRDLVSGSRHYERLTIDAAESHAARRARGRPGQQPLVPSREPRSDLCAICGSPG